jgi:hypothetical protein
VQGELFYLSLDLYELIALLSNFLESEDFMLLKSWYPDFALLSGVLSTKVAKDKFLD